MCYTLSLLPRRRNAALLLLPSSELTLSRLVESRNVTLSPPSLPLSLSLSYPLSGWLALGVLLGFAFCPCRVPTNDFVFRVACSAEASRQVAHAWVA